MRNIAIAVVCVVGFGVLLVSMGHTANQATTSVGHGVEVRQLKAELAGARAESQTLRSSLEKCQAELKKAKDKLN